MGLAEETVLNQMDDALWERLMDLTGGAVAQCYQCGVCTAACPWGLVEGHPLPVRTMLRKAQLGLQDFSGDLWLCTTCAQCEVLCPRGVKVSEVFRGLRLMAWEQRRLEKGLPALLWSLYWNGNPWSQPPSQRSAWARKMLLPKFDPQRHEILLYVGCTASYDRRGQKVAQALAFVLEAAGVRFGYLGDDEPCCGEAALNLGHAPFFAEIAAQTSRCFSEKGVTELVTVSPHCYDVFKNHYPCINVENNFKVRHYTQYLVNLLDQGRLNFERQGSRDHPDDNWLVSRLVPAAAWASPGQDRTKVRAAFQDPCYLGRRNGEYEAPRIVLQAIPGLILVEMERSRANGLCCGGGGGRMWLETTRGARFADLRIQEALQHKADVLATACPFCITCLEDSVKAVKSSMRVMDVAEIAAFALDGAD
jgi:Fe-S oxidoreductase